MASIQTRGPLGVKCIHLTFAVLFSVLGVACIAHAIFTEDLMKCIQKIIDTPHTSERISFCNRIPPDDQDRSLPPQIHICNAYFFPDILFWDPLSRIPSLNGFLRCPREACSGKDSFLRAVGWKDGKTARNNPRRLYGLTCPVMLVSHIYRCQLHHHEILFHDSEVLQQLLEVDRQPFILSHITGMTRELQTTISSYILSGLAFSDVENILRQHLWNSLAERCRTIQVHFSHNERLTPLNLNKDLMDIWSAPSSDFIESVFVADFMNREKLYTARMLDIDIGQNGWISMDHTFKVACNIGIKRKSDNKWETLYDSLFCVMNEMGWQFTKGTSFEIVRNLLQGIKRRCDRKKHVVQTCFVDNCCAWRNKLQSIFTSNCLVKLDLFHAVSRVISEMPKRHPFYGACSKDFTQVLRSADDCGPLRRKATPKPDVILDNVKAFEEKWKSVTYEERPILNIKALDELRKLQKHVTKECLSEIPEGGGSERNENIHKWLRSVLLRNRLSLPLALALFTTYFYVWNEKREHGSNVVIQPVDCLPLNTLNDNNLVGESFGIPHNANFQVNVPRVFLEECQQSFCNTEKLDKVCSDVADEELLDQNVLTKEELDFIIDHTIILHMQFQSLKERGLLPVFNPRFLNLMHQQALFAFDTMNCKTGDFDSNYSKLNPFISGLGFKIIPVPKDGDCLFSSVVFQLEQMAPLSDSNNLSALLERLRLCNTLSEKVLFLRGELVNEWLSNKQEYDKFLTDTELEDMAPEYRMPGVFTGQMGNMMLLGLANVLNMSFVVFTSMESFAVIPVSPRSRPITAAPIYLAFNHAGPGHYDAVILFDSTVSAAHPDPEPVHKEPSKLDGCRCGKGAARKRLADGAMKEFCVQIPGERRVSCPCFVAEPYSCPMRPLGRATH